jgi:hypothetical protein
MKIDLGTLIVALDTLHGSTSIIDNGTYFAYSEKTRKKARKVLSDFLNSVEIDIKEELEKS